MPGWACLWCRRGGTLPVAWQRGEHRYDDMPQLTVDIPFEAWLGDLFGETVGPGGSHTARSST
jgi:hypothetical protein